MKQTGTAVVDHHQFVVGSQTAETYEPAETGSVIEVGPNFVTIMTGIAYGPVSLTIEVLDHEPGELDPSAVEWEVVEEATIKINKPVRAITTDGELLPGFAKLPITKGMNMFRVSAHGRDLNWDLTVTEPTESYLVQVWKVTQPAAMRRLHKTDTAWNDEIVTHPARNFWDPDPAGDATLYLEFGYEQMATWAKEEAIRWGGRPPTDKLQGQPYAREFAGHDRMLVDALVPMSSAEASANRGMVSASCVHDRRHRRDRLDPCRTRRIGQRRSIAVPVRQSDRRQCLGHFSRGTPHRNVDHR